MKIFIGRKKLDYYKGLLIKADLGLHQQIAKKVCEKIPVSGFLLDLGAGEGALSARLVDLGYGVMSVDKDEGSFKCKQAKFVHIDFDDPDEMANFVTEHENVFDAALGVEVIEHVQDQWQYVRQLMRMVKPGGMILITTPNITSWLSRLIFFFTGRFHQFGDGDLSYGHINPISPWELSLILHEVGAVDIHISPAGTLPPIYLTGFNKLSLISFLLLPIRPFMRGIIDGWCVIATAHKPL